MYLRQVTSIFFLMLLVKCHFLTLQQGQGLGRTQQGMSQALAVEKTSKRGGRIVHENDFKKPPPMFGESFKTPPSLSQIQDEYNDDIPGSEEVDGDTGGQDVDEYGNPGMMPPPPPPMMGASAGDDGPKPSITDLMKNPSKVVLCKVTVLILMLLADLKHGYLFDCTRRTWLVLVKSTTIWSLR